MAQQSDRPGVSKNADGREQQAIQFVQTLCRKSSGQLNLMDIMIFIIVALVRLPGLTYDAKHKDSGCEVVLCTPMTWREAQRKYGGVV
jgi:hypothetical protein